MSVADTNIQGPPKLFVLSNNDQFNHLYQIAIHSGADAVLTEVRLPMTMKLLLFIQTNHKLIIIIIIKQNKS